MKVISKLLDMFLYGTFPFFDPHVHQIKYKIRYSLKTKNETTVDLPFNKIESCQISRFSDMKNHMFPGSSHIFLHFLKRFGNT